MTTRLPIVLENIRIASPCAADWDDMRGDERVRFCGRCEKNVYNLSSMSRDDAEALVNEKEGRLCVRFFQRADGTVLTADCPVGAQRMRMRQRVWASLSGVAASAALVLGLITGRARADVTVPAKSDKPTASSTTGGTGKRPVVKTGRGPVAVAGGISMHTETVTVGKMKAPEPKMGEAMPEKKNERKTDGKSDAKPDGTIEKKGAAMGKPRMLQGDVAPDVDDAVIGGPIL
jgi:hypothetical protein